MKVLAILVALVAISSHHSYAGRFGANLGVGTWDGELQYGFLIENQFSLGEDSGQFWGIETGVLRGSGEFTDLAPSTSTDVTLVLLHLSVINQFADRESKWTPYLGASIGSGVAIVSLDEITTGSDTALYFSFHLRPGVEWKIGKENSITFEPRIGLARKEFLFLGTLGFLFPI